jgi:YfiH family protein
MKKIFWHLGNRKADYRALMREQMDIVLGGVSIPVSRMVIGEQTHSNLVHICQETDCGAGLGKHPQIPVVDGFVSDIPNQFLLIRTADCYPVLFYDPQKMVVGAVHSGREGTRKNIAGQAISTMIQHYGCRAGDIVAHIGAGICEQHYEVSEAIWQEFNRSLQAQDLCPCIDTFRHVNIRTSIFQQLIRCGIRFKNIENVHSCTFEDADYFSFRRDRGNNRQINIIGIIDE